MKCKKIEVNCIKSQNGALYYYKGTKIHTACHFVNKYGVSYIYDEFNDKRIIHREDGPAIECTNGDKHWYKDGKLHRKNSPATEYNNGDKFWYRDGKLHREDGPAIELTNGIKFWYLDNKYYSEEEYNKEMAKRKTIL